MKDLFISYTKADLDWARWIAWARGKADWLDPLTAKERWGTCSKA